jgi:hypothetical protein
MWRDATSDQFGEARDGPGRQPPPGSHVIVARQPGRRIARLLQATCSSLDPFPDASPVRLRRSDDAGDPPERDVGGHEQAAGEDVLDHEGMEVSYHRVVVAHVTQPRHEHVEAVVRDVERPLRDVTECPQVGPVDTDGSIGSHGGEGCVPAGSVVHAALPRVVDRHEPGSLGIPRGQQVGVPRHEPGEGVGKEGPGAVGGAVARACGDRPQPFGRDRVDRGLTQPAGPGGAPGRRVVGHLAGPVLRSWPVAVGRRVGVEHDVGDLAVGPLRRQQRSQLAYRTADVEVGPPDRDEGGVPAPLVRIQVRCGDRPVADVVAMQQRVRLGPQLRCRARHRDGRHLCSPISRLWSGNPMTAGTIPGTCPGDHPPTISRAPGPERAL